MRHRGKKQKARNHIFVMDKVLPRPHALQVEETWQIQTHVDSGYEDHETRETREVEKRISTYSLVKVILVVLCFV